MASGSTWVWVLLALTVVVLIILYFGKWKPQMKRGKKSSKNPIKSLLRSSSTPTQTSGLILGNPTDSGNETIRTSATETSSASEGIDI